MPSKRNTKKNKKQQKGKKQKNTTFKKGGALKTLVEIINEKLTDKLVQQLVDNPNNKYSILLNFCDDNRIVVNTGLLLSRIHSAPEEGYNTYKNSLTIPEDFEKGKLMKIIVYANEDGIQYNTIVDKDEKVQLHSCKPDILPILYSVPEITAPSDITSSVDLSPDISESLPEDEELQDILRDSIPYNEDVTSPNDVVEQADDMGALQVEDLEDVTNDIVKTSVSEPTDDRKELQEKIKKEELKNVSDKPELKDSKDDLNLLEKRTKDKSVLRSREEGDVDTSEKKIDFRELAKERKEEKEAKKKQQKEIDRLAHEARIRAEEKANNEQQENIDEEMGFEEISDEEAEKEEESEKLFKKYTDEINIISGILQSILLSGKINSNKTHRNDYTPALSQLHTKYQALIDIFANDTTQNIPKKTKTNIINVLTNNHRRLQALRKYDRAGMVSTLKFESNFMEKVKDSLSIMNTLKTYFETLDESLMTNFGNKTQESYDYTKYVDGGKKTRKNRRKTKRRKTKKRT